MGYDYSIEFQRNSCPTCKRIDCGELFTGYLSYNHSWVFSEYLHSGEGFRQLYDIPLTKVIEKLDIVLEGLRKDYPYTYKDNWKKQDNYSENIYSNENLATIIDIHGRKVNYDGWATTEGNAYLHCRELLLKCKELVLDGYSDAYINGD